MIKADCCARFLAVFSLHHAVSVAIEAQQLITGTPGVKVTLIA